MENTIRLLLERVATSENAGCARVAQQVLDGSMTIETALRYSGSFMTAVLEGDVEHAMTFADGQNLRALLRITEYTPEQLAINTWNELPNLVKRRIIWHLFHRRYTPSKLVYYTGDLRDNSGMNQQLQKYVLENVNV